MTVQSSRSVIPISRIYPNDLNIQTPYFDVLGVEVVKKLATSNKLLNSIVNKLLKYNPEDRPTAQELLHILKVTSRKNIITLMLI